jgi:hypothetical protein
MKARTEPVVEAKLPPPKLLLQAPPELARRTAIFKELPFSAVPPLRVPPHYSAAAAYMEMKAPPAKMPPYIRKAPAPTLTQSVCHTTWTPLPETFNPRNYLRGSEFSPTPVQNEGGSNSNMPSWPTMEELTTAAMDAADRNDYSSDPGELSDE